MTLSGKVAIITGATLGIGRATAHVLAGQGVNLVVNARTESSLQDLTRELQDAHPQAGVTWFEADITKANQVNALVQFALGAYGGIDILINNVGRGLRKAITETSDEEWYTLVDQNLSGTFFACRAVLPHMLARGSGLIVNVASRAGRMGEAEMAAYSAVKAGVIGLTRALAAEVSGKGIRVNAISPGPVSTERMRGLRPNLDPEQWLSPEDVAKAILFLITSPGHTMQGRSLDMY